MPPLLPFYATMLEQLLEHDGLVVLAEGLGLHKLLSACVRLHAAQGGGDGLPHRRGDGRRHGRHAVREERRLRRGHKGRQQLAHGGQRRRRAGRRAAKHDGVDHRGPHGQRARQGVREALAVLGGVHHHGAAAPRRSARKRRVSASRRGGA